MYAEDTTGISAPTTGISAPSTGASAPTTGASAPSTGASALIAAAQGSGFSDGKLISTSHCAYCQIAM